MANPALHTFLRQLRRVLRPAAAEGASDAQLLQRFVEAADEQAFELLVWRHGLMVLNVCRRVLHHEHDAEDAFQATFLALARKAAEIGKRQSLGSWLYKVAYRIALRARNTTPWRSLRDEPVADPASREPIDDLLWREFASAIDEEIQRLPEKYRVAVVLCHLEGQTIESAARSLACPPATVGTWLARARTLLRRRLARRGFDLSSLAGMRNGLAVLSAALVNSTVRAGLLGSAEQAAAAGLISASAAALTKGALQAMTMTRWTAIAAMVLTLGLLGGGGVLLAHRVLAAEPAKAVSVDERNAPAKEPQPVAVRFEWKFKKGEPFYQIFTTKTIQKMKVMGNDVTQNQFQTFYLRWTPEKEIDGKWILAQKILGAKMDIDIGGTPIKYDSTAAPKDNNPLHEFYQQLVDAEFRLTLDAKTLEVLHIDGREKFVNKMAAAKPQLMPLLDKILSEESLKDMADTSFSRLMGPTRPGDSWTKRQQIDLGPLGTCQHNLRFTYEGREKRLDKIRVQVTSNYLPPGDRKEGVGLPFRVQKAALRGEGGGILYFDRAKGCLTRSEMSTNLKGKMVINIGGGENDVELSQTQETAVETMDTNPIGIEALRKENQRLTKENERLRQRLRAVEEALHRDDAVKD